MDVFKEFMSTSSIHGFSHIVSTTRYSRLFWIIVVIVGFSVSSVLINQSFISWTESPVSTSIETLPISQIYFPSVIVCPPKNTRTNLNYDLVLSENLTLDNEGKEEFAEFIKLTILEIIYDSVFDDVKSYGEKDKYRNWYDGITLLELPVDKTSGYPTLKTTKFMKVSTYAKSGTFVTPYFRENFDSKKFSLFVEFKLNIFIPNSVFKSKTVELILEIDYDLIERHESQSFESVDIMSANNEKLESSTKKIIKKISLERRSVYIDFKRSLSQLDVENWNSRRMTGMNVSWFYTSPSSVQSDRKFVAQEGNSYYRKIVSLVHQLQQSEDQLWSAARLAKMSQRKYLGKLQCFGNLFTSSFDFDRKTSRLLEQTLKQLGVQNIQVKNTSQDISDETLELATKIYIYLGNCPKNHWYNWDIWSNFYTNILNKDFSIRNFLLTLSRILTSSREKGRMEYELSRRLFGKLSNIFDLPGGQFSPSEPGCALLAID